MDARVGLLLLAGSLLTVASVAILAILTTNGSVGVANFLFVSAFLFGILVWGVFTTPAVVFFLSVVYPESENRSRAADDGLRGWGGVYNHRLYVDIR